MGEWILGHGDLTDWLLVLFTFVLAVSTILLWWATRDLATDAKKQSQTNSDTLELARKDFISTHRPRLRVRQLNIHPLRESQAITAQFLLVNVGGTPAKVTKNELVISAKRFKTSGPPQGSTEIPVGAMSVGVGSTIEAGAHLMCVFNFATFNYDPRWMLRHEDQTTITLRGDIEYEDSNGVKRATGVIRTCSHESAGFRQVVPPDHDHEYED